MNSDEVVYILNVSVKILRAYNFSHLIFKFEGDHFVVLIINTLTGVVRTF